MVVIIPENKSVENYEGLHLYHGDISNCSMRVRMTLIEKGLDWTSHHIDLKKKENITDDYFGINPNGLVPTLIDDGVVHIESNDIIDYLDEKYPEPCKEKAPEKGEILLAIKRIGGEGKEHQSCASKCLQHNRRTVVHGQVVRQHRAYRGPH